MQPCAFLLTALTSNDNSGSLPQTVSTFWILAGNWKKKKERKKEIQFHIVFIFSIL
jgi:hypothetical protein